MFGDVRRALCHEYQELSTALIGMLMLFAAAASADSLPYQVDDDPGKLVRLEGELVYGQYAGESLVEVLEDLGKQAAIHLKASGGVPDYPVYGDFDGVPLGEVLKRILAPVNYALMSKGEGEPKMLLLLGGANSPSTSGQEAYRQGRPSAAGNAEQIPIEKGRAGAQDPGLLTPGQPEQSEASRLTGPESSGASSLVPDFGIEERVGNPDEEERWTRRPLPLSERLPVADMPGDPNIPGDLAGPKTD